MLPGNCLHSLTLSADQTIHVAVIGAGTFGRNHARIYHDLQQHEPVRLATIVDADPARAATVAGQYGASAASLDEVIAERKVQGASVAVPTIHHLAVARRLIEAGVDVLIEKPLASSLEEADEIARLAERHGRIVQVGHLERFNPAVRATVSLINQPLFFEVHRLSVFTPRSLDVDVVLDLMIHDLDVVLSFVHSPVKEIRAVGLPVLTDKVDIANVRMEFESGCVANFTASRVSTERVRKMRFFQPHQYISLDYGRQDVLVFTVDPKGTNPVPGFPDSQIKIAKPPVVAEEPLRAEIRSFLDAVRSRSVPQVSLHDGRRALQTALEVLSEIDLHSRKVNLRGLGA